jgi:hypothetical protein
LPTRSFLQKDLITKYDTPPVPPSSYLHVGRLYILHTRVLGTFADPSEVTVTKKKKNRNPNKNLCNIVQKKEWFK